jgi:hypothetical protein
LDNATAHRAISQVFRKSQGGRRERQSEFCEPMGRAFPAVACAFVGDVAQYSGAHPTKDYW